MTCGTAVVLHPMRQALLTCVLFGVTTSIVVAVPPHVFVVTSDLDGGSSDVLDAVAPWSASHDVEPVGRDAIARHFYGLHYVVNRSAGTIQVIDPDTFDTVRTLTVGANSKPQDILVVAPDRAYVSRYESTLLHEIDPVSGTLRDTIDLGGFADADGLPEMAMMAQDGNRIFVQIQRVDRMVTGNPVRPSYLAVIDIRTNELLDLDPDRPGPQGVTLNGPIPSFSMHVDSVRRRLVVSTPGPRLDVSGGIEEIDLDALQSLGFIYSEERAGVDLGGFVMISPDRGYVLGHTDIVASSHLAVFDRDPEAPGQGEIYTSLFVHNDQLAYDPVTGLLYYPDATASPPGIHVFDAATATRLTTDPIATGKPPVDLAVARTVTPGEARDLQVAAIDELSEVLALTYSQACGATNHNIVLGPLGDVADYRYTGQVCGIGTDGSFGSFDPGPGSFFFLVVGTDGSGREGSYGRASGGGERPEDLLDPVCRFDQDLSARCDP